MKKSILLVMSALALTSVVSDGGEESRKPIANDHVVAASSAATTLPQAPSQIPSQPPSPPPVSATGCSWAGIVWVSVGWGRAKYCRVSTIAPFQAMTQDTRTDGWCVHVEYRTLDGTWHEAPGSQSCGAPAISAGFAPNSPVVEVRLIRGSTAPPWRRGVGVNYSTLWISPYYR